jgi:hypothetical protein
MLQVIIEDQPIDVDLADTCLDNALCDLIWPLVCAMSNNPHPSVRLLLYRLEPVTLLATASHSIDIGLLALRSQVEVQLYHKEIRHGCYRRLEPGSQHQLR